MIELNKIYQGNCLETMMQLPDASINCCVTSPPYYGLRDYGKKEQLGQEDTPEKYVENMVHVFTEVHRLLKPDGTLWLNLGDSYASQGKNRTVDQATNKSGLMGGIVSQTMILKQKNKITFGLKQKDLIGIPWMVAFALRSAGWYLRQDIIWHKTNPMPESVRDRCTKAHEYIFMLSKSPKYYYDADAIKTAMKESSVARLSQNVDVQTGSARVPGKTNGPMKAVGKQRGHGRRHDGFNERWDSMTKEEQQAGGANKRSVWTVATKPFKDAHFATYPPDLIRDCVRAGCPAGGVVLDPFFGAGTTGVVCLEEQRNYVGCELNPEYINIALKRISKTLDI